MIDPNIHPLDLFLQVWGFLFIFLLVSIFLDRGQLLDVKLTPYYDDEENEDE